MKSGILTRFGVDAIQKAVVRACRQDEAIPNVSFGFFGDMECDLVIVSGSSRLHEYEIKRSWSDFLSADNRQVVGTYKRLFNYRLPIVSCKMILRNGYRMDSSALAVRVFGMTMRSGAQAEHPEWGEPTGRGSHFAIMFDRIIARGTYAEVKEWLEKGDPK